jgi:hypothetical protein
MRQVRITIQYLVWDMWGKSTIHSQMVGILMNRNISELVYDITPGNRRLGITIRRLYLDLNVNVIYVMAGSRSGQIQRYVLPPLPREHHKGVLILRTQHMKYLREQRSRIWIGIQRRMEDLQLKVSLFSPTVNKTDS